MLRYRFLNGSRVIFSASISAAAMVRNRSASIAPMGGRFWTFRRSQCCAPALELWGCQSGSIMRAGDTRLCYALESRCHRALENTIGVAISESRCTIRRWSTFPVVALDERDPFSFLIPGSSKWRDIPYVVMKPNLEAGENKSRDTSIRPCCNQGTVSTGAGSRAYRQADPTIARLTLGRASSRCGSIQNVVLRSRCGNIGFTALHRRMV